MAHINTTSDVSPGESSISNGEWASSASTRNYAYLIMICQAFQDKLIAYYKDAAPAERPARLNAIRDKLIRIKFTAGAQTFTIAPNDQGKCSNGEKPVNGICMVTE
jgi:hypothetical protein